MIILICQGVGNNAVLAIEYILLLLLLHAANIEWY